MKGIKRAYQTLITSSLKNIRLSKSMLNTIFIFSVLALLLINNSSYRQINTLIAANDWVTHTWQVIQKIDDSLYGITKIENSLRMYQISSAQQLLNINSIKSDLNLSLNELDILTKKNIGQNKRVMEYKKLINQQLTLLVQLQNNKPDSLANTDIFSQNQAISNLGQEIKSVETALLNERNTTAIKDADTANFILIIASTISIIFLILAFLLANIELFIRRNTENKNIDIQAQLRRIIESTNDMIAAFDIHNRFIIFNEAYRREFRNIFGKSIAIGMCIDDAFSEARAHHHNIIGIWKESLKKNKTTRNIEIQNDNEKKYYEINSNVIKNNNDECTGLVHTVRDVTTGIQEHSKLQNAYEELARGMEELQYKNKQINLLVDMSDIMLACVSQEELIDVTAKYSKQLLHFTRGYLYIMHPSKNYLELATSWGHPKTQATTFTPDQCWAIKLGRRHHIGIVQKELVCSHVKISAEDNLAILCVPLTAQNNIYGLLYMETSQEENHYFNDDQRLLINAFAELIALALANVRLRENLQHQSIRDPLTGLYNRRYLDDYLFKHTHQAERNKTPFSILLMDLDHFKRINDHFGHDAGDAVLKEVGKVLQNSIRIGDIATRYGGEEFVIVLYDITVEAARKRAESIRQAVMMLKVKYGAQQIGSPGITIGISAWPDDGKTSMELIEKADTALYNGKKTGRNRVIFYSEIDELEENLESN